MAQASIPANDPIRNVAIQRTRKTLTDTGEEGWDVLWREGVTPWDRGVIRPALSEALRLPELDHIRTLKLGNALVPGCGRGYDVIYIAQTLGIKALGLDLSAHAVNLAKESVPTDTTASFLAGSFFDHAPEDGIHYDIIYDVTFFCAIPPGLRSAWGQKMCELIAPGGYLITLCYPIDGERKDGPPYSVHVDAYAQALGS